MGLGFTLTCIDVDGPMYIMQISKSLNALHPCISGLPAPLWNRHSAHNGALREHFHRSEECNRSEQRRCT